MSIDVKKKRDREKRIVTEMISLYCKKNHHTKKGLCKECKETKDYAMLRSALLQRRYETKNQRDHEIFWSANDF